MQSIPPRPWRLPRVRAWAIRDLSSRCTGGADGGGGASIDSPAKAAVAPGCTVAFDPRRGERIAILIWRMCSGVVPQQPPTRLTPSSVNRRAYDAMYSGEHR